MTSNSKYSLMGNRIKYIRDRSRLTQTKFANSIGLSRPALSAIENGITKPSMMFLYIIEAKYKCRPEWVLTGNEPIYLDDWGERIIFPLSGYETSDKILSWWWQKFIRIFEEGNKDKIEALKAQIRALDPKEKSKT